MNTIIWGCPYCTWERESLGEPEWDEAMIQGHLNMAHPIRKHWLHFRAWRMIRRTR